jgi:hypothetical protein
MMPGKLVIFALAAFIAAGCAGAGGTKAPVPPERPAAGDEDRAGDSREECLRSIRRARLDARDGIYRMYVFGSDRYDERFARYLGEYLKTRYGIELILFGKDGKGRDKCYSNEMDKILFNTFGPDILARAEEEAREMYDRGR